MSMMIAQAAIGLKGGSQAPDLGMYFGNLFTQGIAEGFRELQRHCCAKEHGAAHLLVVLLCTDCTAAFSLRK